jgi:hypothetical protein
MATEEAQNSLVCPGRHCSGDRVDWWCGSEIVVGTPPRKFGGHEGGPAEWTCRCEYVVIRDGPYQQALDDLPVSNLPL